MNNQLKKQLFKNLKWVAMNLITVLNLDYI